MMDAGAAFTNVIDYLASLNKDVDPDETCPVCGKRLYTVIQRYGKIFVLPIACDCSKGTQQQREARARAMAVTDARTACFKGKDKVYRKVSFADDTRFETDASKACMAYAAKFLDTLPGGDQQGRGLMLYGGNGTGKTFFSVCIANALLDHGYKVLFTSIPDIEGEVKASYGAEADLMDRLYRADLVILDDFGSERGSDYTDELAFKVMEARKGKPVVITTNLTPSRMVAESSPGKRRLYDRLFERLQPVKVDGESLRRSNYSGFVKEGREWLGGEA